MGLQRYYGGDTEIVVGYIVGHIVTYLLKNDKLHIVLSSSSTCMQWDNQRINGLSHPQLQGL